jgi:hypothetical protein
MLAYFRHTNLTVVVQNNYCYTIDNYIHVL